MTNGRVTRQIYISSGLKNGFYTLRLNTSGNGFETDIYLRNLSTDPYKAKAKAKAYFDRVYGDRCLDVSFVGYADFDLSPWGSMEPWERAQMADVEKG